MPREPVTLTIPDLSSFAKSLREELKKFAETPGHLGLLNMLARAGGFSNYQHVKARATAATPSEPVQLSAADLRRHERVMRHFDGHGRMTRWPSKTSVQALCLWGLWSSLPPRQSIAEKDLNAHIDAWHLFGDRALLRRSLIGHGLFTRTEDGRAYHRIERQPPAEALAVIRALLARQA